MTNLTTTNNEFDWNVITNPDDRQIIQNSYETFITNHQQREDSVMGLIAEDTIELSSLLSDAKERLPHGEYHSFCKDKLNLNRNKIAAYGNIARSLAAGGDKEDVIALIRQMEPLAASMLLKASEDEQKEYVNRYQQTGETPSQRDFRKRREQAQALEYNTNRAIQNEWSGEGYAASNLNTAAATHTVPVVSSVVEEPAEVIEAPVEVMSSTDAPDRSELFTVATAAYDITKQLKALRMSLLTEHSREARSYAYAAFQDLEEEIGKCMQMSVSAQETLNRQTTTTL